MYENLPTVYYRCGWLGHLEDSCRFSEGDRSSDNSDCTLLPDNFVDAEGLLGVEKPVPMMAEGKGVEGEGRPRLEPWLVTSCIRQPWAPRAPLKGRREVDKEKESGLESSDPRSLSLPRVL